MMNLQILQKDKELEYHKLQNEKQQKQMDKLQVNHITYVQNNILSYKDTDLSHLTNKDYIGAIKKVSYCVKDMIEKNTFQSIQT